MVSKQPTICKFLATPGQARPYSNVASVHVIFIGDSSEESGDEQKPDAQKDRYTLIEQSNTLLKRSLHMFCTGPLKFPQRPRLDLAAIAKEFISISRRLNYFGLKVKQGLVVPA